MSAPEVHFWSCLALPCGPPCVAVHLNLRVEESHNILSVSCSHSQSHEYLSFPAVTIAASRPLSGQILLLCPRTSSSHRDVQSPVSRERTAAKQSNLVSSSPVRRRPPRVRLVPVEPAFRERSSFFLADFVVATFFHSNLWVNRLSLAVGSSEILVRHFSQHGVFFVCVFCFLFFRFHICSVSSPPPERRDSDGCHGIMSSCALTYIRTCMHTS